MQRSILCAFFLSSFAPDVYFVYCFEWTILLTNSSFQRWFAAGTICGSNIFGSRREHLTPQESTGFSCSWWDSPSHADRLPHTSQDERLDQLPGVLVDEIQQRQGRRLDLALRVLLRQLQPGGRGQDHPRVPVAGVGGRAGQRGQNDPWVHSSRCRTLHPVGLFLCAVAQTTCLFWKYQWGALRPVECVQDVVWCLRTAEGNAKTLIVRVHWLSCPRSIWCTHA